MMNPKNELYPEDLRAIEKMDEFHTDKQNMDAKKKNRTKAKKG